MKRVYDNTTLYVTPESKSDLAGMIECTDVYFQRGASTPQRVR